MGTDDIFLLYLALCFDWWLNGRVTVGGALCCSECSARVLPCASSNCFPSLPFLLLFISMNGFYLTIQKNAPTNEPSQQREKTTRQFHLVIFLLFWCVIVNHHQHNLTVHSIAKWLIQNCSKLIVPKLLKKDTFIRNFCKRKTWDLKRERLLQCRYLQPCGGNAKHSQSRLETKNISVRLMGPMDNFQPWIWTRHQLFRMRILLIASNQFHDLTKTVLFFYESDRFFAQF